VRIEEILSPWMGESERSLHAAFEKARSVVPCVLFLDELDALAFARRKHTGSTGRSIVDQLLQELDAIGADNEGLLVLGATNAPWDVDEALKRPGRFDRVIFVPPPDEPARAHIVELKLQGVPTEGVDAKAIAAITPHFSGADIEGLVEIAKDFALEDHVTRNVERSINQQDLLRAAKDARASTLDWLRTARNLVKYAGADDSYAEVDRYLKAHKLV